MTWNYAELSKEVKEAGGPEKFLGTIESTAYAEGKSDGKIEMTPWIGFAAILGSGITYGIMRLVDYLKTEKAKSQDALDRAKGELIQGIKDYDATHFQNANDWEVEVDMNVKEVIENE